MTAIETEEEAPPATAPEPVSPPEPEPEKEPAAAAASAKEIEVPALVDWLADSPECADEIHSVFSFLIDNGSFGKMKMVSLLIEPVAYSKLMEENADTVYPRPAMIRIGDYTIFLHCRQEDAEAFAETFRKKVREHQED